MTAAIPNKTPRVIPRTLRVCAPEFPLPLDFVAAVDEVAAAWAEVEVASAAELEAEVVHKCRCDFRQHEIKEPLGSAGSR